MVKSNHGTGVSTMVLWRTAVIPWEHGNTEPRHHGSMVQLYDSDKLFSCIDGLRYRQYLEGRNGVVVL